MPSRGLKKVPATKPYCFVSYSTQEAHTQILIDCLRIVFTPHFDVTLTPSALESGASQRERIASLIEHCDFAVVILDGLRPNVIFEYGIIEGKNRPVLLFKETEVGFSVIRDTIPADEHNRFALGNV